MKILVICQYYYPEPFRITDICEELVRKGHQVTVLTGVPNYPMGKIYDGYEKKKKRSEIINGVNVCRCSTIPRKHGVIWRFLNYYSFAFSSSRKVNQLKENYDVVFVNQLSPVMMARAGIRYKKKHGTKLVLYSLDLWPESLVLGGIKKDGILYRYYNHVSKKIYSKADRILVTSYSFCQYFKQHFDIDNCEYLPQYAEDLFSPEDCKKEQDEYFDVMFAGNVGKAQSVDTILDAAYVLKDRKNIRWHIVGDGSELLLLMDRAKEKKLVNVIFYGRKPLEEMPKYYAMADAMIVSMQKDPVISLTLPGKVQTYLAAGKPIIGTIDGETKKVIENAKCGFCSDAENANALAENVIRLSECGQLDFWGRNARKYYDDFFSKESFFELIEKILFQEIQ